MCDLLNLTKFISFSSDFCAAFASHNCNELIEFRFPTCLCYFLFYFLRSFPYLLSLSSFSLSPFKRLLSSTLFFIHSLYDRVNSRQRRVAIVAPLRNKTCITYYGELTLRTLSLPPRLALLRLLYFVQKGLTATPPVRTFVGLLFFGQFNLVFHFTQTTFDFAFLMNFSYCEFLALNFAKGGVAGVRGVSGGERCRLLPVVDTSSSFSRELSRVDKLTFRLSQLLPGLPTVFGDNFACFAIKFIVNFQFS